MKRLFGIAAMIFSMGTPAYSNNDRIVSNDTIRTFNLEEVVLTSSTKETNDLRTLPAAVTVLSPQQIIGRQVDALKDISTYVPNLYIPDYGAKLTSAIYIRGIGARSSGQSIGMYVDNVPYLDKSTFNFELTDIQRIEVLRGPQGTLYGRNAMGGIVNIYTISPFDFQGKKVAVSAGNYGQFKVKASHYGKLSDKFGFTAGVYYNRNNGFFTNEYNGEKADKEESVGGRIRLEGRLNPQFKIAYTFSGDYTDQGAFPYGLYDTETGNVAAVSINDPSSYKRTMLANSLLMEYKARTFVFNSTTGYQYLNDDMKMDQDFSPKSIFTLNQLQRQHALSQELTFKSVADTHYQWSFGLYGFYNHLSTDGPVTFKEEGIQQILQPVFDRLKTNNPKMPSLKITDKELYIPGSFQTPSFGISLFHQSTYNDLFVEGLSLTAGLRVDYEKQKLSYQSEAKMNMSATMGPITIPLSDMYEATVMDEHIHQDFWQILPKISLKYACSPSTYTYFSVTKGYKAGGYNVQMSADVMQAQMKYDMMSAFSQMIPGELQTPDPIEKVAAYKPEKSINYELGTRSELIGNRLNAELTLFYMDIRDLQITQFVNSGNGRILTNAGKARSMGVEASLRARISSDLSADWSYGYTHAVFRDYNNGKEDFEGKCVPYTPRHTTNVGLQYAHTLRGKWLDQVYASAQLSGTGKIYWTEQNDICQPFYLTLNARAGVRKGIVNVSLWGRNLTNTRYAAFYFESFNNPFIQLGKPLQFGAEIAITL